MKLQLDCREVSRLLSARLDGAVPASDRARMRLHFVICQHCRNVEEQMAFLRAAMRRLGRDEAGPQEPR